MVRVPATIIRSHWRGLKRMASAPKRAEVVPLAATAIISMAQQASAEGHGPQAVLAGHVDDLGEGTHDDPLFEQFEVVLGLLIDGEGIALSIPIARRLS